MPTKHNKLRKKPGKGDASNSNSNANKAPFGKDVDRKCHIMGEVRVIPRLVETAFNINYFQHKQLSCKNKLERTQLEQKLAQQKSYKIFLIAGIINVGGQEISAVDFIKINEGEGDQTLKERLPFKEHRVKIPRNHVRKQRFSIDERNINELSASLDSMLIKTVRVTFDPVRSKESPIHIIFTCLNQHVTPARGVSFSIATSIESVKSLQGNLKNLIDGLI